MVLKPNIKFSLNYVKIVNIIQTKCILLLQTPKLIRSSGTSLLRKGGPHIKNLLTDWISLIFSFKKF